MRCFLRFPSYVEREEGSKTEWLPLLFWFWRSKFCAEKLCVEDLNSSWLPFDSGEAQERLEGSSKSEGSSECTCDHSYEQAYEEEHEIADLDEGKHDYHAEPRNDLHREAGDFCLRLYYKVARLKRGNFLDPA